jgi:tripartite-type tricarboxylate transporter receptor subunit TctC
MHAPFLFGLATLAASLLLNTVAAQPYPTKPVKMIVPTPAGAPPDVLARLFARSLTGSLGGQVLVENRSGAGWTIGATEVAKAIPDGYTLLWGVTSVLALGPSLFPNATYDIRTDFAPVGTVNKMRMFLVVHPSIPAATMKEFVDYARARPGQINYSSAGNGTLPHLAMEMFKSSAGLDLVHVPFKGNHFTSLVAGDVQAVFDAPVAFAPFVRAGKARLIAVASSSRDSDYPTIPTAAEAGIPIELDVWQGVLAPRATAPAIIAQLNASIRKAIETTDYRDAFARFGVELVAGTPEQFGSLIAAEHTKWTRAWKTSGAKLD